jgi:hypothetical protein
MVPGTNKPGFESVSGLYYQPVEWQIFSKVGFVIFAGRRRPLRLKVIGFDLSGEISISETLSPTDPPSSNTGPTPERRFRGEMVFCMNALKNQKVDARYSMESNNVIPNSTNISQYLSTFGNYFLMIIYFGRIIIQERNSVFFQ